MIPPAQVTKTAAHGRDVTKLATIDAAHWQQAVATAASPVQPVPPAQAPALAATAPATVPAASPPALAIAVPAALHLAVKKSALPTGNDAAPTRPQTKKTEPAPAAVTILAAAIATPVPPESPPAPTTLSSSTTTPTNPEVTAGATITAAAHPAAKLAPALTNTAIPAPAPAQDPLASPAPASATAPVPEKPVPTPAHAQPQPQPAAKPAAQQIAAPAAAPPPASLPASLAAAPPAATMAQAIEKTPSHDNHFTITPPGSAAATAINSPPAALPALPDASPPISPTGANLAAAVTAMQQSGESTATLRLDPPGLGNLTIYLNLGQNNAVNILFVAAVPQTAQIIANHLNDLRQAMDHSGLSLGNTQIGSGNTGAGSNANQQYQPQQPQTALQPAPLAADTSPTGIRAYA